MNISSQPPPPKKNSVRTEVLVGQGIHWTWGRGGAVCLLVEIVGPKRNALSDLAVSHCDLDWLLIARGWCGQTHPNVPRLTAERRPGHVEQHPERRGDLGHTVWEEMDSVPQQPPPPLPHCLSMPRGSVSMPRRYPQYSEPASVFVPLMSVQLATLDPHPIAGGVAMPHSETVHPHLPPQLPECP